MHLQEILQKFDNQYGTGDKPAVYFSPGRVNLIGEHIDYNGGYVFPGALTLGIHGLTRPRIDGIVRFSSLNLPNTFEINLSDLLTYKPEQYWANYPIGVLAFLLKEGHKLQGADVLFASNLPDGAGLSSSAALEVLTAYMFLSEAGTKDIDRISLARLAQRVENQFVGVNCGIMDQFSVANGKKDHALLLNCQTLDFEQVPLQLREYSLVIMNTNKRRELAESKYNERRGECDRALAILNQFEDFPDLCSANMESVEKRITDKVLKARSRHVITENERVIEARKVLKEGDLKRFGDLLKASHHSLRYDYEVTGHELDEITDAANEHPACLGSRMTGAGFGGCAIALVETAQIANFQTSVSQRYQLSSDLIPHFYVSQIGDGVHKLLMK